MHKLVKHTHVRRLVVPLAAALTLGLAGASTASADQGRPWGSSQKSHAEHGNVKSVTVNGLRLRNGPSTSGGTWVKGLLWQGNKVQVIRSTRAAGGQTWHYVLVRSGPLAGWTGWATAMYLY
ncbi:hypothetical protein ACIPV3_25065 [Streptomyces albidoflavus]